MHDEKRGERYFSMHRLTGAELAKLIDVKLLSGMQALDCALHRKRRRILSESLKAVKQEV
jgi:hypothetical protein